MNLGPLSDECVAEVYLTLSHKTTVRFFTYEINEGTLIFRGHSNMTVAVFATGKWLYIIFRDENGDRQTT